MYKYNLLPMYACAQPVDANYRENPLSAEFIIP